MILQTRIDEGRNLRIEVVGDISDEDQRLLSNLLEFTAGVLSAKDRDVSKIASVCVVESSRNCLLYLQQKLRGGRQDPPDWPTRG
jgi:hypothetical protein